MDSWTRQTLKKASADREKRLGKTEKLLQLSEKSYKSFCNSSGKGQPGGGRTLTYSALPEVRH